MHWEDFKWFFTIAIHDENDCIIFKSFFLQNQQKPETEIFAFWAITREPIKIQIHTAYQNDRLNLGFMKDIHGYGKKMGRNGGKMVIYE